MLPQEEIVREQITSQLADAFERLREILSFAVSLIDRPGFTWRKGRGLWRSTLVTCLGVYAKACKQCRGLALLCEHGLASDAETVSRALFESSISLRFLLRHYMSIRKGERTGTQLRTKLFLLWPHVQEERRLKRLAGVSGEKRRHKAQYRQAQRDTDDEARSLQLDASWVKRLRAGQGYSTLPLYQLCERLGIPDVYAYAYPKTSAIAHATDIWQNHATLQPDGRLALRMDSSLHEIELSLHRGCTLMATCIGVLHNRLHITLDGVDVGRRLEEFRDELVKWNPNAPPD